MPITDLATLGQLKAWVPNVPASADDALLGSLITAATQAILSSLQRPTVLSRTYTDVFDGYGETRKMLRKWPVTSITALTVGSTTIGPSSGFAGGSPAGYVLDQWDGSLPGRPQLLDLRGAQYRWGTQNISVAYKAGYLVANETQTVASGAVTVDAPNGPWAEDAGVTYADGTPLTKVASNPAQGQYTLDASGKYDFNSADDNVSVLISYSYVPQPLNQACIEMAAEAYLYRSRIGERSHTTPGPQTTTFDLSRMTAAIKMMIDPFRMVVPIP